MIHRPRQGPWASMVVAFVFTAVLFVSFIPAQFQHLTIKEGLSQNTVYSIAQDQFGLLYFGTQDGLNLFNGYDFHVIRHRFDSLRHPSDNNILCMVRTRSGIMWLGTEGGGLDRFNPQTGMFRHYRHDPADPHSISGNFITALCVDSRGRLWAGTRGGKLNRFDPAKGFVKTNYLPAASSPSALPPIQGLAADAQGRIWVGTGNGLFRLNPNTGQVDAFRHDSTAAGPTHDSILCLLSDPPRGVWIGSARGLSLFDKKKATFTHFRHRPGNPESLPHDRILALAGSVNGSIWAGTGGGGLARLFPEADRCVRYSPRPHIPDGLNDEDIYSLYEDQSGVLWIGTSNHGINKLTPRTLSFHHMRSDPVHPLSLHNDIVWSILEDHHGRLWVGTELGVDRWTPDRLRMDHFHRDAPPARRLSHNLVRSVCEDREGRIWIGSDGGGIDRIDGRGRIRRFHHRPNDPASLSSDRILTIAQDRSRRIWIGTRDAGLNLWLPGKGFQRFRHAPDNPRSLSNDSVYSVYQDSRGNLLIGTLNGLNRMRANGKDFDHFQHDPRDPYSIPDNGVGVVTEDSRNWIWIGTDSGMCRYDPENGLFRLHPLDGEQRRSIIYGILEDQGGMLWVSTNRGLYCYDPTLGTSQHFDARDGLQSNEFNTSAALRMHGGELYFGGIEGITHFRPEEISRNPHVPNVILTEFRVFNRPMELSRPPWAIKDIRLSHRMNFFSLEFAALDYTSPTRNRYAYRLSGFDPDWVDAGRRRTAHYTNVPPGRYLFQVQGSNNDGTWNRAGLAIAVTIPPPFWATLWFRFLVISILLGLVALSIWLRVRRIREQRNTLRRQVAESTRQLRIANRELERLSREDGLTGLANQRMFQQVLRQETRRSMRTKALLSLIIIDVDLFKAYNDTYGHEAGNECLRRISAVMHENCRRTTDTAARYGGEEFSVLMPGTTSPGAIQVAESIRREVEALDLEHRASPVAPRVTISLGVATIQPKNEEDGNRLVMEADKALYRAKRTGRNRVCRQLGFQSTADSDIP